MFTSSKTALKITDVKFRFLVPLLGDYSRKGEWHSFFGWETTPNTDFTHKKSQNEVGDFQCTFSVCEHPGSRWVLSDLLSYSRINGSRALHWIPKMIKEGLSWFHWINNLVSLNRSFSKTTELHSRVRELSWGTETQKTSKNMLPSDFEGKLQIMNLLWRQLWDEIGSKSADTGW